MIVPRIDSTEQRYRAMIGVVQMSSTNRDADLPDGCAPLLEMASLSDCSCFTVLYSCGAGPPMIVVACGSQSLIMWSA